MRGLIFLLSAFYFIFSQGLEAAENHFRETDCGPDGPAPNFYSIRFEAPDGTLKRLTFNNKGEGLLVFKSTSLKYLKWSADLQEFDDLIYQSTRRDFGMLSVRNWEQLTIECGWPQEKPIETLKSLARRIFVAEGTSK